MIIVDLFSGLGGFSEGPLRRGWVVYRFDNDPEFASVPHTYIVDVLEINPEDLPYKPDLLVASPPCTKYSALSCWRWWPDNKPGPDVQQETELVKKALEIKNAIKPKYWLFENPVGKMKEILGPADVLTWWAAWGHTYLKPTCLWGVFPPIEWPPRPLPGTYEPVPRGSKRGVASDTLTPATRSLIPFQFSDTLAQAVEQFPDGPFFGYDLQQIKTKWL